MQNENKKNLSEKSVLWRRNTFTVSSSSMMTFRRFASRRSFTWRTRRCFPRHAAHTVSYLLTSKQQNKTEKCSNDTVGRIETFSNIITHTRLRGLKLGKLDFSVPNQLRISHFYEVCFNQRNAKVSYGRPLINEEKTLLFYSGIINASNVKMRIAFDSRLLQVVTRSFTVVRKHSFIHIRLL